MDRQVHARAEADWKQALDLEKKLKACSRKRSFFDSEMRSLRKQLRDTYESLLFLDAAFAAANDVEGQLWRSVFYMPIEEFRARIRKADKEAQHNSGPVAVGAPDAATIMAKTAAAFLKFLDEAALFYKRLVMQLQSAYGDVKVRLELPAGIPLARSSSSAPDADGMQISTGSSIARDMRTSIHRCLVFLGDLSRYGSQAAPKAAAVVAAPGGTSAANTAAKAEWSKAVGYYRMAAHVLPRSGNPHNQLAVMAFMTGEELKAAYHYARSLCVSVPFLTARENLLQLLQSNRDRYVNLLKQRQVQQQQGQGRPVLTMQQQLAELGTCYVRLVGLLYDRINQHEYPHVAKAAFEGLAGFLDHPQLLTLLQRQRQYDCTPLHMVVLSIFVVHHSFGGAGAGGGGQQAGRHHDEQLEREANGSGSIHSRPTTAEASGVLLNGSAAGRDGSSGGLRTYAGVPSPLSPIAAAAGPGGTFGDAAQRSVQRGRSLAMLFRTGRLLAQAATAAVNAEAAAAVAAGACNGVAAAAAAGKTGATCLLVGLNVVLQWLAAQPNCAVLQAATATEEDVKARSKFWTAASQLLLVLAPALNLYEQQRQQPQKQQLQQAAAVAAVAGAVAAAGGASGPASSAGGAASGSLGAEGSCEDGALPEDLELLGFEPLRSRHYWHVTEVGKHAVDETRTRIKRMIAAARVTSAALAADQQQQLMARHVSGSISAQSLNQLGTAVQQFIEVVAMVGASSTPTASLKVPAAAAGVTGMAGSGSGPHRGSGAPTPSAAGRQQPPPPQQLGRGSGQLSGQQSPGGPTAMDIDGQEQQPAGRQGASTAAAVAVAAGAAAAGRGNAGAEEDEEEEVIVFKPRISRLSSPALEDGVGYLAPAAAAAPTAGKAAAGGSSAAPAAATAGHPPLPQTLLAGRQGAVASPQARYHSPAVQMQQQNTRNAPEQASSAAARAAAAAGGSSSGGFDRPGTVSRSGAVDGTSRAVRQGVSAGPAAVAAGLGAPGGALLQGHAATALDLQQAQAASDMLLARLTARQGLPGAPGAAAPGFGGSSGGLLAAQQQQRGMSAGGAANGFGAQGPPGATAGYPTSSGFPAGFTAAGSSAHLGQSGGAPMDGDVTMEQALLGSGLAALLGGLGDELMGQDVLAAAAGAAGGHSGQNSSNALAAVSAAVAASMHAAGLGQAPGGRFGGGGGLQGQGAAATGSGAFPSAAASMAIGLDDPLATLGMLGIPSSALGLSVGIPGSMGGALHGGLNPTVPGMQGAGFGGLNEGLGAGPMRSVSASAGTAAAAAALAAGGRKVSAPVGILQQAAADAAAGLRAQQEQQQQQLSSSYVANHQMEETALDAVNQVLSPDMHSDSGMALLQQHQRQQQRLQEQQQLQEEQLQEQQRYEQQQHQQQYDQLELQQQQQQQELAQQQQQQQGVGGLAAALLAGPSDVHSLHSGGGSWLSGSTSSTPNATTPRATGGLAAALQQQQLQLQAHMAQRRLSAGSASPRSAVGAERGLFSNGDGTTLVDGLGEGAFAAGVSSRSGRMSVPSFLSYTAGGVAAGDAQLQQQRSSIGAMFAGPDLFAPAAEQQQHQQQQRPPVHRRSSSGASGGALMGGGGAAAAAAATAAGGGALGLARPRHDVGPSVGSADISRVATPTAAAGLIADGATATDPQVSLFGVGLVGNGAVEDDMGSLLPSSLGEVLGEVPGGAPAGAPAAAVPSGLLAPQQQQQMRVVEEGPDLGEGGMTLVEYLAAQQRKLQQQGWGGVLAAEGRQAGLQAAVATGADLSAHVLLPPLDFAESQNPFG